MASCHHLSASDVEHAGMAEDSVEKGNLRWSHLILIVAEQARLESGSERAWPEAFLIG